MASWASVAKASAQPVVAAQDVNSSTENLRLLVVDANAIIGGLKLEGIADRAVTIPEVFAEIRDKQSRQFLSTLPYKLQLLEPTEDSVTAVTRFARETGDIAVLSSVDLKLLALAHTLEVAAHGTDH
ncbi:hypothetical protein COO60DRAFT_1627844 [Scenedesmus sp. NREL 46B-D3]|nr:hypothetical protein COO60DRAFT_1627844 [Scenedesmus sp. NREL 46B-D3]